MPRWHRIRTLTGMRLATAMLPLAWALLATSTTADVPPSDGATRASALTASAGWNLEKPSQRLPKTPADPAADAANMGSENWAKQHLAAWLDELTRSAQQPSQETGESESSDGDLAQGWFDGRGALVSVRLVVTMTLIGLVPAVLLMTTSYVRISIVLSMLRQAFGAQQLLPAQATMALAMFCTGIIMWPTWTAVYDDGLQPLLDAPESARIQPLWEAGIQPIRKFMVRQIINNHGTNDVHLFLRRIRSQGDYPTEWSAVPLTALMPGYLLSELKTAFLIGFQIYLPFLVIDLVVATFATSLGMFMLPPAMVSLPLKLLMFVMVDGWHLIVEMLLSSFV